MVNYRRDFTAGGMYFFTLTLNDKSSQLLTFHIKNLGIAFRKARHKASFQTLAFVVLPDHLHVIWQLPINDYDYSRRWLLVKALFSRSLIKSGLILRSNKRGEYNLWQRRFWEHRIRNETDYEQHVNYIHFNPVKHDLWNNPLYGLIRVFIDLLIKE